jgi:hypothetical protein
MRHYHEGEYQVFLVVVVESEAVRVFLQAHSAVEVAAVYAAHLLRLLL